MEERGYTVIRCLGQGGQSRVYEVHDREGKLRVVKQLPWMGEQDKEAGMREVQLLSSLRHPCIVPYLESFLARSTPSVPSEDLLCLVMSRCERDLRQECLGRRERGGTRFEEPRILSWLAQISWGLQHLHSRKFLHRDLKPQNVLLTQSGRVLLADFGVAGHLEHTEDFRRSIVGTPAFMSPEMLEGRPYGFETDQWALGCVLYEIMALEPPFATCECYAAVVTAVLHSPPISAPPGYSAELAKGVEALLARKPHDRPSNTELLRGRLLRGPFHAFLQSLDANAAVSATASLTGSSLGLGSGGVGGGGTDSEGAARSPSQRRRATTPASTESFLGLFVGRAADSPEAEREETRLVVGGVGADNADAASYGSDFESYGGESPPRTARMLDQVGAGPMPESGGTNAGDAVSSQVLGEVRGGSPRPSARSEASCGCASSGDDMQEVSANILGSAGVSVGEWRQLVADAEALLRSTPPEHIALEEAQHVEHMRATLCDLLGTEAQVGKAMGFLRERRPLGETVEADELLLQVEVLDLLGDDGLRALPLLEQLLSLEGAALGRRSPSRDDC